MCASDRSQTRVGMLLLGFIVFPASARAQTSPGRSAPPPPTPPTVVVPVPPTRVDIDYVTAIDSLADRIRAIGEYEESLANAYETTMRGHLIHEAAYSAHLDNRVKELATAYARREMRFQEKEREIERILEHDLNSEDRKKRRLLGLPKGAEVFSGADTLNLMLGMIIHEGWEESLLASTPNKLDEQVLSDLCILLGSGDSASSVPLRQKGDSVLSWEPPRLLQDPRWRSELEQYQQDRAKLESALRAGQRAAPEDHVAATASLDRLALIIDDIKPEAIGSNKDKDYILFKELRKFVREQGRQLGFLATGQTIRKPFTGDSVQSLIAYMAMYGYRFAPPAKNGNNSYKAAYDAMKEVLETVVNSKTKEQTP